MNPRSVACAAIGAISTAAVMCVAYQAGRGRDAAPDTVRAAIRERLESPGGIEERLVRIEDELASLRAARAAQAPGETAESAPDESDRWASVSAALSALQLRVKGLEDDPVRRGYTFLESENAELRREGVNMLTRVARFDPEARAALRAALSDPSRRVREQAAQRLGDLADKESAPEMRALLEDPDAATRRRAVQALGAIEAREAAREIGRNLVSDPDDRVRESAADVLGTLRSREAEEFLTEALKDRNEAVRGEAIAALGEIGATSAAPQLRAIYDQDPGNHRLRLVLALKSLGDIAPLQREIGRLSDLVRTDADERVRGQAIRELSILDRDSCQEIFSQALEDPSPRVRREAERALR